MIKVIIETTYENLREVINATLNPKVALRLLEGGTSTIINHTDEVKYDGDNKLVVRAINQNIWKEYVTATIEAPAEHKGELKRYTFDKWNEMSESSELYELKND